MPFIKSLGLENFLSYYKQEPVPLGRLNVLVGKNSSGKSAILHALALLSETMQDPGRYTSLLLAGNGLNLGTYQDVVYRNRPNQSLSLFLSFDNTSDRGRTAHRLAPTSFKFTFKGDNKSLRPYVSAITAYDRRVRRLFTLQGYATGASPGYRSAGHPFFPAKPKGTVASTNHFLPYFQIRSYAAAAADVAAFYAVNESAVALGTILQNLVYLGPSRAPLDSVYFPVGRFPSRLDSTGSNAVPLILGRVRKQKDERRFKTVLQRWLGERFNLVTNAALESLTEAQGVKFIGKDPLIKATVLLSNTGYGVSQVLPIVLQLAIGKPCVLLIEQPEIHLHPSAQAELANLLVAFSEEGYQLIVETHSEHLLLRLRAILARKETSLAADDVRLFHVEKGKMGSHLHPVPLSDTGALRGWPRGFFSASSTDLADLLKGGAL